MSYSKLIYFTVSAPSLDVSSSWIVVKNADDTPCSWCHFVGFEQVDEYTWKIIIEITEQYYYLYGEPDVRYAYITGVLFDEYGAICKNYFVESNVKIRQVGCLYGIIKPITYNSSGSLGIISQVCDYVEFINYEDTVETPCEDNTISGITLLEFEFEQLCDKISLLCPEKYSIGCDDIDSSVSNSQVRIVINTEQPDNENAINTEQNESIIEDTISQLPSGIFDII